MVITQCTVAMKLRLFLMKLHQKTIVKDSTLHSKSVKNSSTYHKPQWKHNDLIPLTIRSGSADVFIICERRRLRYYEHQQTRKIQNFQLLHIKFTKIHIKLKLWNLALYTATIHHSSAKHRSKTVDIRTELQKLQILNAITLSQTRAKYLQ